MMPSGPAAQHGALVVEPAHEDAHALVDLAQHILRRHLAVLEYQLGGGASPRMPSLSSFWAALKPFIPFSMSKAVMPRGPAFRVRLGVDHQRVGIGTVGDPHLAAVEHIAVAALLGAELHSRPRPSPHWARSWRARRRDRPRSASADICAFAPRVPFRRIGSTHRFECAPYDSPTAAEARDSPPWRRNGRDSPCRRRRTPPRP